MDRINIFDIVCLILCFVIIGWIGIRSTKKTKSTNDFILADRSLNKLQMSLSLAASDIGGSSLIGATAYVYTVGISGSLWNLSAVPAFIILGYLVTGKLRSLSISTVPEFLGNKYGKRVRLYASVLHILSLTTMISAQFIVSATVIHVITGISTDTAMIISLIVVILYTAGGGLTAVVNTDIFQFLIIMVSVIILVPLGLNKLGGIDTLLTQVPDNFLRMDSLGFWTPLSWVLLCFFTYGTNQTYLQRVFASKDKKTASFGFYVTGIIYIFYGFLVGLIGLIMSQLLPGLADPNLGFALMIQDILPHGLLGLAIGGVFAATMSTADSYLLGASSIFINDIYKEYNKDVSEEKAMKVTRIITVLVALIGILIAKVSDNIIDVIFLSGLLYSSTVFFPLMLSIGKIKLTKLSVELGISIAFIVGLISEFYLKPNFTGILGLPSNILSSSIGLIVMLSVAYITNKKDKKIQS